MVCREQDAIDAHLEQQVEKGRSEIEAAKCVVNIFSKIRADGATGLRHSYGHHVESLQHKREGFAHVADYDLQLWKLVEYSAEDHAKDVDRGFDVPAPPRPGKHLSYDRRKTSIRCVDHRLRRRRGMEIYRDVKQFSTLKDWPEEPVIEVAPAIVAIDDRSFKAMCADHAVQLFGSVARGSGRQGRKSGKACWIFGYGICEKIVRFMGQGNRRGSFELL